MSDWKRSRYLKQLKEFYINEKLEKTPSEYYKIWTTHKFKHSVGVMNCAVELIKKIPRLKKLPDNIKAQIVDAALLHNLARVKEVNWQTGDFISMDHGLEGAKEAFYLGEKSFLTLIAIWIHNKYDESYLSMSDKDFEKTDYFKTLNEENQIFVKVLRKNYKTLPEKDKDIINWTVALIKDADKVDNMLNPVPIIVLSTCDKRPVITPSALEEMLAGTLVQKRNTLLDEIIGVMSWVNDLRFQASFDWIKKDHSLEKAKISCLDYYNKESPATLDKIAGDFDKAIKFLYSRY